MWLKYPVSVFRRFSTRYFGICHFFLRYCGIGYPPMSPSLRFPHPNPIKIGNPAPAHYQNCRFPLLFLARFPNITTKNSQIPHPAKPIVDPRVTAQWTGGVTVVFSCLTLVSVCKLRVNAELSNRRSVLKSIIICRPRSYFVDAFIISTWFTPRKPEKRGRHYKYTFQ